MPDVRRAWPQKNECGPGHSSGDLGDTNGPGPGTPFAVRLLDNSADPEAVPKCEFDTALQQAGMDKLNKPEGKNVPHT